MLLRGVVSLRGPYIALLRALRGRERVGSAGLFCFVVLCLLLFITTIIIIIIVIISSSSSIC